MENEQTSWYYPEPARKIRAWRPTALTALLIKELAFTTKKAPQHRIHNGSGRLSRLGNLTEFAFLKQIQTHFNDDIRFLRQPIRLTNTRHDSKVSRMMQC